MASALIVRGSTNISTASWDKLNATSLVCSGLLRVKSGNSGTVSLRWASDTTNTVTLEAGGTFQLMNVDLSEIEVQGSAASQGYEFVGDTYRSYPG